MFETTSSYYLFIYFIMVTCSITNVKSRRDEVYKRPLSSEQTLFKVISLKAPKTIKKKDNMIKIRKNEYNIFFRYLDWNRTFDSASC